MVTSLGSGETEMVGAACMITGKGAEGTEVGAVGGRMTTATEPTRMTTPLAGTLIVVEEVSAQVVRGRGKFVG
jgi:hypothetical protein